MAVAPTDEEIRAKIRAELQAEIAIAKAAKKIANSTAYQIAIAKYQSFNESISDGNFS